MTYQMTEEHKARIRAGVARRAALRVGEDPEAAAQEALVPRDLPPIMRFRPDLMDTWLSQRLLHIDHSPARVASMCQSNDYLFITNSEAVLCAVYFDGIAIERFAFARHNPEALIELYKYARDWTRSLKAEGFIAGVHSDLQPSQFERFFRTDPLVIVR